MDRFPDLISAYRLALKAKEIGFEIVTLAGESTKRRWDLSKAERVLGYVPEYRLEESGYTLRDEPTRYDEEGAVWGDAGGTGARGGE